MEVEVEVEVQEEVAALHLAISKSSLTILAPSPTYFCTSSDPITLGAARAGEGW